MRELKTIKMGQPDDFSNFVSAVIDKNSFNNIKSYIDEAKVYSITNNNHNHNHNLQQQHILSNSAKHKNTK